MPDKCSKYEGLFIFGPERQLEEHIAVCASCREQHEKMKQTSLIAKEAAPYYRNFGKQKPCAPAIKAVAGLITVALVYFLINNMFLNKDINVYNLLYNAGESVISEMGLPTDDYGLFMVY